MSEETILEEEQHLEAAASEQADGEAQDNGNESQKMVPLAAVLATRKKLQEAELRAQKAEAEKEYVMRMHAQQSQPAAEPEEDPKALIERQDLRESTAQTKRDILETLYQDMNPEAVQKINKHLKSILEKKPWLASSIDTAPNRYARAYEIVQDYIHLVEEKPPAKQSNGITDGQRIIQNAHKPRSPVEVGKSAQPKGMEYLKSVQGKKEFREYRQKVLRGES